MAVSSLMVPLGTPAPDFTLGDVTGGTVRRDDLAAAPALLVAFLCNHCPYVRHIEGELGRLLARYPTWFGRRLTGQHVRDGRAEQRPGDRLGVAPQTP